MASPQVKMEKLWFQARIVENGLVEIHRGKSATFVQKNAPLHSLDLHNAHGNAALSLVCFCMVCANHVKWHFCLVFQTVERIAEFPAGADGAVSAVEVSRDKYDKNNRCGKHVR